MSTLTNVFTKGEPVSVAVTDFPGLTDAEQAFSALQITTTGGDCVSLFFRNLEEVASVAESMMQAAQAAMDKRAERLTSKLPI